MLLCLLTLTIATPTAVDDPRCARTPVCETSEPGWYMQLLSEDRPADSQPLALMPINRLLACGCRMLVEDNLK